MCLGRTSSVKNLPRRGRNGSAQGIALVVLHKSHAPHERNEGNTNWTAPLWAVIARLRSECTSSYNEPDEWLSGPPPVLCDLRDLLFKHRRSPPSSTKGRSPQTQGIEQKIAKVAKEWKGSTCVMVLYSGDWNRGGNASVHALLGSTWRCPTNPR